MRGGIICVVARDTRSLVVPKIDLVFAKGLTTSVFLSASLLLVRDETTGAAPGAVGRTGFAEVGGGGFTGIG